MLCVKDGGNTLLRMTAMFNMLPTCCLEHIVSRHFLHVNRKIKINMLTFEWNEFILNSTKNNEEVFP